MAAVSGRLLDLRNVLRSLNLRATINYRILKTVLNEIYLIVCMYKDLKKKKIVIQSEIHRNFSKM